MIEVEDLDATIALASQAPSVSWGHLEIRPTAIRYVDGEWLGVQPVR